MKRPKDTAAVVIEDHETLGNYCRRFGIDYGTPEYRESAVVLTFRERLRRLQNIGRSHEICAEELLLMLSMNFGFVWDSIPYGKFGDTEQFAARMGQEERFAILWPEYHAYYKRTTDEQRQLQYQKSLPLLKGLVNDLAMPVDDRGELPLP